MGDDLGCNNIQNHREGAVPQNYQRDGVKRSESRLFFFIFRFNIVLHDLYQTDKIIMEIEEWKQKVPDDYVKTFSKALLGVLETSVVS